MTGCNARPRISDQGVLSSPVMRPNSTLAICVLLTVVFACRAAAKEKEPTCMTGHGSLERGLDGYSIQIKRGPKSDGSTDAYGESFSCHATLRAPDGKVVFSRFDAAMDLYEADKDINGDGVRDLVFAGYSMGAHCCWTYWVVSLGDAPRLLGEIENQTGGRFEDLDGDGRLEFLTEDGAFDYFDGVSHADTVFPTVILRLEGSGWVDVGREFRGIYDQEIRKAGVGTDRIKEFLLKDSDRARMDATEYPSAWHAALTTVLAYLYSGRERRAWKALREMWPPADQQRMQRLIVKTRQQGVLRYVSHPKKRPK